jgi:hypothetical protein
LRGFFYALLDGTSFAKRATRRACGKNPCNGLP